MVAEVEVNWEHYFQFIEPVCPWSLAHWKKGNIDIEMWKGEITPLHQFTARLYVKDSKVRLIKKLSARFNHERPWEEWLYSHPDIGKWATPVPVLIQQDRTLLNRARKGAK